MSQEELAFESDLNRQFISLLELGQRSPSLQTVYKIAVGLGIRGSELLLKMEARKLRGRR
jgi:transcriptional regulator with XRE-family HTH domain